MNSIQLLGRMVREPELRYTPNGTGVARFTLAVNRKLSKEKREEAERNNQPTADFIGCQAWGKSAETIANYVKKGDLFLIQGRIQTGSYDDKDGKRVYTTDVVVESFDFVQQRDSEHRQQYQNTNSAYTQQDDFYQINNDDIPFL